MSPNEPLSPDHPLLTAFALGELEGTACTEVAQAVAGDPQLEQAVQQIRAQAGLLRSGYEKARAEQEPLSAGLAERVAERLEQTSATPCFNAALGEGTAPALASWRRPLRNGRLPMLWWSPFVVPTAATFTALAAVGTLWWGGLGMDKSATAYPLSARQQASAAAQSDAEAAMDSRSTYTPLTTVLPVQALMRNDYVPEALATQPPAAPAQQRSAPRHGPVVTATGLGLRDLPGIAERALTTQNMEAEAASFRLSARDDLFAPRPWAYLPIGSLSEEEALVEGKAVELVADTAPATPLPAAEKRWAKRVGAFARGADRPTADLAGGVLSAKNDMTAASAPAPAPYQLQVRQMWSQAQAAEAPAYVPPPQTPAEAKNAVISTAELVAEAAALVRPINQSTPMGETALNGAIAATATPATAAPTIATAATAIPAPATAATVAEELPAQKLQQADTSATATAALPEPVKYSAQTIAALEASAFGEMFPSAGSPARPPVSSPARSSVSPPARLPATVADSTPASVRMARAGAVPPPRSASADLGSAYVQLRLWVEAGALPPPDLVNIDAVVRDAAAEELTRSGGRSAGARAATLDSTELVELEARVPLIAAVRAYARILRERPADGEAQLAELEAQLRALPQQRNNRRVQRFLKLLAETQQLMR